MKKQANCHFSPDWIGKIKENNQKVITTMYNTYKETVFKSIYRILKNTEVAEDLTNDVFLKIIEQIDKYRENISFNSWIKTMSINLAIDYHRKTSNKNTFNSIDDEDSTLAITDHSNPESDIINDENVVELVKNLKRLPPSYERVLELRFYKNLSYEEIADVINKPVGTVKATLHKAKNKLKQLTIKT